MIKLPKLSVYYRVNSIKHLNPRSKNLNDNLYLPPKVYEKKLHDEQYIRGIRETINYRKFGKMR